jgi:hypothetical protein
MLNFSQSNIRYEPYPLAVLKPAMERSTYDELSSNYPDLSLFGSVPKYDYKSSLSEKFNSANYHKFIRENRAWNRFHSWLKSDDFIRQTIGFLAENHIDLRLEWQNDPVKQRIIRSFKRMGRGQLPSRGVQLRTRFEFSVLKADGGEVAPHTDIPRKVITFVLSMVKDGEWKTQFGGGLDVNRATDNSYAFNWANRMVPWEKIEIIDTIPFVPNQCIIFVKTFNSLHSVRKMKESGSKALRKSVTIVIERDD